MNNWEKCPVCNGSGKYHGMSGLNYKSGNCPTCKGQRIISSSTGLPPNTVWDEDLNNLNKDIENIRKDFPI